jgi:hypothetical protein
MILKDTEGFGPRPLAWRHWNLFIDARDAEYYAGHGEGEPAPGQGAATETAIDNSATVQA